MNITKANAADFNAVKCIVHWTIKTIYPKYYPKGAVEFFINHHSDENIIKAINTETVLLIEDKGIIVGTGSARENEIVRMFVLPQFQGRGYGLALLDELEYIIGRKYSEIVLDASMPAYDLYTKLGYEPIKYEKIITKSEDVLCYHTMKKSVKRNIQGKIDYDNKLFSSMSNTINGEVSSSTIFEYHQKEDTIWAEYSGGEIIKGFLVGTSDYKGNLNFTYQHMNIKNEIRTGKCFSTPEILPSGKIRLLEQWQWTNGDNSVGESVVEEVASES